MLNTIISRHGESFPHNPIGRGYHVVYRKQEINYCPGCGRSHWYVGRSSAECGFCGTAIPLDETNLRSASGGHSRNRRYFNDAAWAA